jgi:hypothetical protein
MMQLMFATIMRSAWVSGRMTQVQNEVVIIPFTLFSYKNTPFTPFAL